MKITSDFVSIPLKKVIRRMQKGSNIVQDKNGSIPYISPASIRRLQLRTDNLSYTSEEKLLKGNIRKITVGEVLMNTIGDYRGSTTLVTNECDGMLINRHVLLMVPNNDIITPEYLAVVLNTKPIQQQIRSRSGGVTIQHLNMKMLGEINLPVPDLKTQENIYVTYFDSLSEIATLKIRIRALDNEIDQRLKDFK